MPDNIGQHIQHLRLEKGLSLSELAGKADVAKSYLSNVERNIQSNPSIQFIEKIAEALDVPVHVLLYGEISDTQEEPLDSEWFKLVQEAMASGVSKREFKEFLDYQKWRLEQKDQ
ncbi:Transcriptional regulator, contains XRE-family HTH domain [Paenibacillus sophorae]|uniref:Helix-turn-helix domain-containing protein n=1 Tax=Paenibacillus sophorae TaxID=1333845 RepID=A0A1H8PIA7_9BACL|nr:helix-turn-helix domain-containing protein [Paenibacillus sophorae]QWU16586.1 helix-turn-helix domain-containing protein [Paenibacillus sophorae]SEO41660.1 Transcriptional regulator, contains XRE-family HTH domain [Paenibacillus sophorae]